MQKNFLIINLKNLKNDLIFKTLTSSILYECQCNDKEYQQNKKVFYMHLIKDPFTRRDYKNNADLKKKICSRKEEKELKHKVFSTEGKI